METDNTLLRYPEQFKPGTLFYYKHDPSTIYQIWFEDRIHPDYLKAAQILNYKLGGIPYAHPNHKVSFPCILYPFDFTNVEIYNGINDDFRFLLKEEYK